MDKKKEEEEESEETMSRKVKRKAVKKAKRQLIRQEMAVKLREQFEDPDFLHSLHLIEQDEAERSLRARTAFEESERAWLEAMDLKAKTILQHEKRDDEDWDLVEVEGPPEIIWKGNEIILRKNKIRDRPISNPFPPDHGASSSPLTAPVLMEQIPNFGTELDKAHCPFHLKTGACRFGQRCSRVHFHPVKSCTLLIRNMYNGPGLALDQDEGLEHTDEEVERSYEEFYDDVHTEFLKFGEIVNFKVCRNGSSHLRGNVYVHFKSLDSAVLAYQSINARYFAGKQVSCEFVSVSRWKVAICGEYMKTRFKTCSRGSACNFIHCFCNPGGDYEWANNDKPPPRHWVTKMIALFGYSDEESAREGHTTLDSWDQCSSSRKISTSDTDRHRSKRSRSMETDYTDRSNSGRRKENEDYVRKRRDHQRYTSNDKVDSHTHNGGERMYLKESSRAKKRTRHPNTGESFGDGGEICKIDYHDHKRRSSQWNCEIFRIDFQDRNQRGSKYQKKTEIQASDYRSSREWLDGEHGGVEHSSRRKSLRGYKKVDKSENCGKERNTDEVSDLSDAELANRYSHKYISKQDSPDENLESIKCKESNYSRKNDERYSVNSPDSRYNAGVEEVIEHDRWEPELCTFEKHGNC